MKDGLKLTAEPSSVAKARSYCEARLVDRKRVWFEVDWIVDPLA